MKRLYEWLKTSNRWKYLAGGLCIGIGANNWYCTWYASLLVAGTLEYKKTKRTGKWNWINSGFTIGSAVLGHLTRIIVSLL